MKTRFGQLLRQGIKSVANRQNRTAASIRSQLGDQFGYTSETISFWERGNLPLEKSRFEIMCGIVSYCINYGFVGYQWAQSILQQVRYPDIDDFLSALIPKKTKPSQVFICYAPDQLCDRQLAITLAQKLRQVRVFFDAAEIGNQESRISQIQEELERSDFIIVLLSQAAKESEVIHWELALLQERSQQIPLPFMILVRINFRDRLPKLLEEPLLAADWTFWRNEKDTPRLINEIQGALAEKYLHTDQAAQQVFLAEAEEKAQTLFKTPLHFRIPGGAIDPNSLFYVPRKQDENLRHLITQWPLTFTIKGPRQIGKSSLLARAVEQIRHNGKKTVWIDFQLLKSVINDPHEFYLQFCLLLTRQLDLPLSYVDSWDKLFPNNIICTHYLADTLLPAVSEKYGKPLVLAMDEVDMLFSSSFRDDFFAMLRNWHNQRAIEPIWNHLSLILVTSTEPHIFIKNLYQSPFNVGDSIEIDDFTAQEVEYLNTRFHSPFNSSDCRDLFILLGGHPYLTSQACYRVASRQNTVLEVFSENLEKNGPFEDHLKYMLRLIYHNQDLLEGLHAVLEGDSPHNMQTTFRLRGAGVIKSHQIDIRCPLYKQFFRKHLYE